MSTAEKTTKYSGGRKELSDFQFAIILTVPVIVFSVVLVIYPLAYSLWISFREVSFFGGFHTVYVGGANWVKLVQDPVVWNSLYLSVRFTAETTILALLIAIGISLVMVKAFPARSLLRAIIILPWAVSIYASGIIFKFFWRILSESVRLA